MEMSLSEVKVQKIIVKCLKMLDKKKVSIREISQLIGTLSSTSMAVLPAPLQYRFLQKLVIQELNFYLSYEKQIVLSPQGRAEIKWLINNIRLNNGRSIVWKPPQLLIRSDASKEGWGDYCQGERTGGPWSNKERDSHINILELKAAKFAILTYTQNKNYLNSIPIQMDNMTALCYLVKMGGNKQSGASEIKQTNLEPFDFIGDHSYCRTSPRDSKYRSGLRVKECEGLQRVEAREQDFSKTLQEIRVPKDKSICLKSIQTAKEILFLENRPFQCRQGCVSSKLVPGSKLCLSPIQSDRTSTSKGPERKVNTNSYNAGMADSVLVSKSNGNGYINTSSSPCYENLLSNPKKEIHPLLLNQS